MAEAISRSIKMSNYLFSRRTAWILLAIVAGLAVVCLLPFRATNITPASSHWTVKGSFEPGGVYHATEFDKNISTHERHGSLWGSWCGSDTNTGELLSPPFKAPAVLEALVAGYPGKPGVELFLEREDNRIRVPLFISAAQQPGERWKDFQWRISASLVGQRVRLVAVDKATGAGGWLGISAPRGLSLLGLLHQQLLPALLITFGFIFDFALFLLPGLALATVVLARRPTTSALYIMVLIVATSATLGYISFWAFFFAKLLGKIFCFTVYAASASTLTLAMRRKHALKPVIQPVAAPFAYAACAGILYLCFLFILPNTPISGANYARERFFDQIRPGDNLIPFIFANKIYAHEPLRPFCCGDWLSSDRPPLQSGIALFERPIHVIHNGELDYELLTAALQCLWICGVWCLLTALDTPSIRIRQSLGFLIFSGFLFYNSVYTWPKLLAAAFILFILGIVFEAIRTKRPITHFGTTLASACLGLALMAHPGSVFSLAAFAIVVLRFRRLFPLRQTALGFIILAAYILPWSAYQKFVDPPGNRLLKMHLAGEDAIDSRSALQGITDAYRSHTLADIIRFKVSNLILLAGQKPLDTFGLGDFKMRNGIHLNGAATESSRVAQREWIWNAVGLLNVGWVAGLLLLFRRRGQRLAIPAAAWLVLAALINLIVWSLITFGPNETVTTHSSYADILLLNIGLLGFVLTFPSFVYYSLLALQVFNFFVVWVWLPPQNPISSGIALTSTLQLPLLLLGGILTLVILFFSRPRLRSSAALSSEITSTL